MTPETAVRITAMGPEHADEVLRIYRLGIDEGNATFETTAPTWDHFNATKLPAHRHVAVDQDGNALGRVAAAPVSDRCVHAGVVEHSVYVHPDARCRGIGTALLGALIASTEAAGIFPGNAGSIALHQKAGFRVLGRRERIGRHHDVRRDVVLIERRSPAVGQLAHHPLKRAQARSGPSDPLHLGDDVRGTSRARQRRSRGRRRHRRTRDRSADRSQRNGHLPLAHVSARDHSKRAPTQRS